MCVGLPGDRPFASVVAAFERSLIALSAFLNLCCFDLLGPYSSDHSAEATWALPRLAFFLGGGSSSILSSSHSSSSPLAKPSTCSSSSPLVLDVPIAIFFSMSFRMPFARAGIAGRLDTTHHTAGLVNLTLRGGGRGRSLRRGLSSGSRSVTIRLHLSELGLELGLVNVWVSLQARVLS